MESDLGCTLRIYFDNVTLTLHNVMLISQNHVNTITNVIAAKQKVINEVYVFSIISLYFFWGGGGGGGGQGPNGPYYVTVSG